MKGSLCLRTEKKILPNVQALKYKKKYSQPSSPNSKDLKLKKNFIKFTPLIKPKEIFYKTLEKTNTFETQASQTTSNLQLRLKLRPYKGVVTGKKQLKQPQTIKPWNSRDPNKNKEKVCLNIEEDALFRPYSSEILIEKYQKEFSFKHKLFYWRKKKLAQYQFANHNSISPKSRSSYTIKNSYCNTQKSISPNSSFEILNFAQLKAKFSLKDYFIPPIPYNIQN